jgi:UDP-N-acetylmuramoyl-tripeptide--D-alanyl-D-alanine ligase
VIEIVSAFVLTAGLVAGTSGGRLVSGSVEQAFGTVSIDSRTLAPGALFIALRGERFDGHRFVDAAVAAGAAGVMVEAPVDVAPPVAVVQVPDTLAALHAMARETRRRSGTRVVAITGSTGKTSTKEMTAELLAARGSVFRNAGNLNNHIGLPLSLLELRRAPAAAVVELGMNHAGEIRTLVGIAAPDVRVWTNVGDAHFGFFGSREDIARAKAEILEAARPSDVLVANADDELVTAEIGAWPYRRVLFGEGDRADVRASDVVDRGFDGTEAQVATPAGTIRIEMPLPGRGQLHNALAAIAVANEFGVDVGEMPARLSAIRPVGRRGLLTRLANGARLVDDSYNASPVAVEMMVASLAATRTAGRRVAVLGEMLELGEASLAFHHACGVAAGRAGIDLVVAIGGPAADGFARGAAEAGVAPARILRFEDSASAAGPVAAAIATGDLVLVKGSRGTRTDIVADRLLEGRS